MHNSCESIDPYKRVDNVAFEYHFHYFLLTLIIVLISMKNNITYDSTKILKPNSAILIYVDIPRVLFDDFFLSNLGEKVLASSTNGRIPLTSLEETRLKEATQDRLNQEQLSELIDLVSQIHLKQIELEAEKTESMRKSLVETLPTNIEEETVENILCQWQMIQKRIFYYQEVAARSYFKFIKLNDGGKEQRVISATLRLLQVMFFKKSFN